MMKKGFTLLELIVVIVILGVLATLGITQYGRMVEKMRGAEAYQIIGDIRKLAMAYCLQNGTVTGITAAAVNIGTAADQIPSQCRPSHYFYYLIGGGSTTVSIAAVRCVSGGKPPQYSPYYEYEMVTNEVCGGTYEIFDCGTRWGNGAPCP